MGGRAPYGWGDGPRMADVDHIARAKQTRRKSAKIFGIIVAVAIGAALVILPSVLTPPPKGPFEKVATVEELLAPAQAEGWRFARLEGRPGVLLIEFPSLQAQGAAMNRIAALIEKAGAPRDRVLNDLEMLEFIRDTGSAAATFYYGHDYRLSDLARFYTLAEAGGVELSAAELRVRDGLSAEGLLVRDDDRWTAPVEETALVSYARVQGDDPATVGVDETLDPDVRETILRHELSHGVFFTDPEYRSHAQRFWNESLTEGERQLWRAFLASRDYDSSNEEMMLNEAQAFLMHTPDPRVFSAAALGVTEQQLGDMRARFRDGAPEAAAALR